MKILKIVFTIICITNFIAIGNKSFAEAGTCHDFRLSFLNRTHDQVPVSISYENSSHKEGNIRVPYNNSPIDIGGLIVNHYGHPDAWTNLRIWALDQDPIMFHREISRVPPIGVGDIKVGY